MGTTPMGIAVRCDAYGRVHELLRDSAGLINAPFPSDYLKTSLVAEDAVTLDRMLDDLLSHNTSVGWTLRVETWGGPVALEFAGVADEDEIVIIAAPNRKQIAEIAERFAWANRKLTELAAEVHSIELGL